MYDGIISGTPHPSVPEKTEQPDKNMIQECIDERRKYNNTSIEVTTGGRRLSVASLISFEVFK